MRVLTNVEIKGVMLDVLQDFHGFCVANGLKYSLCAGTLLGAIRHKGFIPWDDDIDVMMPRREYEKFLKTYHSDNYTLYSYKTNLSYKLTYAKLCDKRTQVIENSVFESDDGIDIDIFPLDFFPDSVGESEKWVRKLKFLKNLRDIKNMKILPERSFVKNVIVLFSRIILFPLSMDYLVRKVDSVAQKYASKTDGFLGNMTNGYGMKERNPMASSLIDVEFEGRKFKAINNYDIYLSGLFGDYMTPPPVNKRVSTHTVTAWWKE